MRAVFLGSGSAGNATLIASGETGVLIDVGFSARETLRRLAQAGEETTRVAAILVTHEHADHVSGVRVLARRLDAPVIASAGTQRAAASCLHDVPAVETVAAGDEVPIAGLRVRAFATAHDAAEPLGYVLSDARGRRIGIATDTGVVTPEMLGALEGCSVVGIEANHDVRMLFDGPYPYFLKKRIASERGHLSNDAAAEALCSVAWPGLSHVFALHLSERNNTPAIALGALRPTSATATYPMPQAVGRLGIVGCAL